MPFFSIIIPMYNAANTLAETLQSIKKQTFTDWELIAVNDGSTDETQQIFEAETQGMKSAILISQMNNGLGHARNTAVKKANGEWLVFLDADDLWAEQKLAELFQFIGLQKNVDFVYHPIFELYPNGNLRKRQFWEVNNVQDFVVKGNPFVPSAVAIKRSVYKQYGGFIEDLNQVEDLGFWLKLLNENLHLKALKKPLTKYRMGSGITRNLESHLAKIEQAIFTAEDNGLISPAQRQFFKERKYYETARQYHKQGDFTQALRYYAQLKKAGLKVMAFKIACRLNQIL